MAANLAIAARNVLRHKRRTLLTVLTMTVSIGLFVYMDSIMGGMDASAVYSMADYSESGLRLSSAAYGQRRMSSPLEEGIENPQEVMKALLSIKEIAAATPRTPFQAQVSGPAGELPVKATVIDPRLDPDVFKIKAQTKGAWLSSEIKPDDEAQILIGISLAQELGLGVGERVTLYAKARYDTNRGQEFKIVGLVESPDPNLNSGAVFISYAQANEFLDLDGLVTEIRAAVSNPGGLRPFLAAANAARDKARLLLPGMEIFSLDEMASSFMEISKSKRGFSMVLVVVLLFISAVGIVNTILMSVYSRIREIGVLGAFGYRRSQITRLFLTEGLLIGLIGASGGALLGFLLSLQAVLIGMPLDKMAGKMDTTGIPIWGTLYGEWNPLTILFGFCFGLFTALVASYIPARRAGRMRITNALRSN